MPGIEELAEDVFGVNVKTFVPQEMNLRSPAFTQVIGLVDYVTTESEIERVVKNALNGDDSLDNVQEIQEEPVSTETDNEKQVRKAKKKKARKKKSRGFWHMLDDFFD